LPGGRAILYTARASDDWTQAQVVVQSIDGGHPRTLISNAADGRYVGTGHLLYMKLGTLMAVPFDPARLQITGAAVTMVEGVMQAVNMGLGFDETGAGEYVVAENGTLAYVVGGIHPNTNRQLVWVDRRGTESALREPPGPILTPRISPDGQRLVYFMPRTGSRESDVWMYDLTRDTPTRLTFDGDNNSAIWSPDGRHVIFSSGRPRNLFWMAADGGGSPERLTASQLPQTASTTSANNLVSVVEGEFPPHQISVLSLEGDRKLGRFLQSPFALTHPVFSTDGRWLAYVSSESGQNEVYVQAYPGPGVKYHISTQGGTSPAWAGSGRELFYVQISQNPQTANTMMAVHVDTTNGFTAEPLARCSPGPSAGVLRFAVTTSPLTVSGSSC
jgi:serine/threonine-protein kinase